ncbi:RnfABCDGE type electron transport complex subunit A [Clostridium botulinum]|uniref:Ion-translocating oxidoreductase complex subunit A n=1 Tax=Clostridium botulinum TaxID=1491 RepID=A0A6B4TMB7_CLOBO|nr:RnfABCDGE type electron transport complex subunit A [Clostridium botulinum]NFC48355.1 RnfABCDGE type electron transport complex subunit A [Clostridium botulinum]NFC94614.1 RnfABCDGE type electron transport complex subunit A [Clostridium botulinum]NFD20224.1 RnfABCDGE type electron transport complex subunit A [Clostridium botulinum]NFD26687.1 RnfABCDGE type electron transport complex subunit A [Clostridium botulinum]NFD78227.1 RnfABCDGE type electron transport complex subunit A [Clostridium 
MKIFALIISALFVNNFVLARFLGICSFLGVSKKVETATGMGLAVTFVMALASLISYIVYSAILVPLNITYLYTIAFILVIAALVQFVEMVIKKKSPGLYKALGIFLPLITTNCAILGAVIINMNDKLNLIESLIFGTFSGLGYMLAIVLLAGLRERMEACDKMPKAMEGLPISLITAGLMAIAFLGFQGLLH